MNKKFSKSGRSWASRRRKKNVKCVTVTPRPSDPGAWGSGGGQRSQPTSICRTDWLSGIFFSLQPWQECWLCLAGAAFPRLTQRHAGRSAGRKRIGRLQIPIPPCPTDNGMPIVIWINAEINHSVFFADNDLYANVGGGRRVGIYGSIVVLISVMGVRRLQVKVEGLIRCWYSILRA